MAKQQPKYKVLDVWRDSVYNKHGFYPQMNRNTEQWAARDLIDSYGLPTVLELIEYYEKLKNLDDLIKDKKSIDVKIRKKTYRKRKFYKKTK